jgi:cytochrome c oxidase subunit 2
MTWLLDPSSAQGVALRDNWYLLVAAGTTVGAFVYGAIFWSLIAYRRRSDRAPAEFSGNAPLEILYVLLPLAIVIALFVATLSTELRVDRVAAHPRERIAVTAFRWSWRFEYAGSAFAESGTPERPPTLYLPLGRATQIDLRSADVTHSFWVPAFLFKRDAIPGMTNVFDLQPTRLGDFPGRCAQFCGLDHAHMTFVVRVIPPAAYDRLLASDGVVRP